MNFDTLNPPLPLVATRVSRRHGLSVLRQVLRPLVLGGPRSWKDTVNAAVRAQHKPVDDLAWDTLTDHLQDVLVEEGLLAPTKLQSPVTLLAPSLLAGVLAPPPRKEGEGPIPEEILANRLADIICARYHATYDLDILPLAV